MLSNGGLKLLLCGLCVLSQTQALSIFPSSVKAENPEPEGRIFSFTRDKQRPSESDDRRKEQSYRPIIITQPPPFIPPPAPIFISPPRRHHSRPHYIPYPVLPPYLSFPPYRPPYYYPPFPIRPPFPFPFPFPFQRNEEGAATPSLVNITYSPTVGATTTPAENTAIPVDFSSSAADSTIQTNQPQNGQQFQDLLAQLYKIQNQNQQPQQYIVAPVDLDEDEDVDYVPVKRRRSKPKKSVYKVRGVKNHSRKNKTKNDVLYLTVQPAAAEPESHEEAAHMEEEITEN